MIGTRLGPRIPVDEDVRLKRDAEPYRDGARQRERLPTELGRKSRSLFDARSVSAGVFDKPKRAEARQSVRQIPSSAPSAPATRAASSSVNVG